MKNLSINTLFSLTLLLSVSSALANPVLYGRKDIESVPVVLLSPYEKQFNAQGAVLSLGVGLGGGAVLQTIGAVDPIVAGLKSGNINYVAPAALIATLGVYTVLHNMRKNLQDGSKEESTLANYLNIALGTIGFLAGVKVVKG